MKCTSLYTSITLANIKIVLLYNNCKCDKYRLYSAASTQAYLVLSFIANFFEII